MFCPKCSHEQSLEEMRFCSRCGFPLGGVALLLDNQGDLTKVSSTTTSRGSRGRMLRDSALFTVVAWVLALASTLFWDFGNPAEGAARVAAMILGLLGLVGLIRFTYVFLFAKVLTVSAPEQKTFAGSERAALPPQQSARARDFAKRSDTREMMPRTSVTESTTRLLENEVRGCSE